MVKPLQPDGTKPDEYTPWAYTQAYLARLAEGLDHQIKRHQAEIEIFRMRIDEEERELAVALAYREELDWVSDIIDKEPPK